MEKKKLNLKSLSVKSFVTKKPSFEPNTIKGGGSDLFNPCHATETCAQNGCDVGGGGSGASCACPSDQCPTRYECPSRPPNCSDLFSPCAAY